MIVIDASALIDLLLRGPAAAAIERRMARREILCAPHLIDAEVAQVLRRFAAAGRLDDRRGREALEDLAALRLRRFPHGRLLPEIWRRRHNLTAYDAAYVALAEALDSPLVTRDRRLAAAAGPDIAVEVI